MRAVSRSRKQVAAAEDSSQPPGAAPQSRRMARERCIALVCAFAGVSLIAPGTAAETIYKCRDDRGRVLYTSEPCPGGKPVDIQAGKGDPHALERLRQEDAAFNRRMSERRAAEAKEAELRREAELKQREVEATERAAESGAAAAPGPYWGWPVYPARPGYGPPRPGRPDRPDRPDRPPTPPGAGKPPPSLERLPVMTPR